MEMNADLQIYSQEEEDQVLALPHEKGIYSGNDTYPCNGKKNKASGFSHDGNENNDASKAKNLTSWDCKNYDSDYDSDYDNDYVNTNQAEYKLRNLEIFPEEYAEFDFDIFQWKSISDSMQKNTSSNKDQEQPGPMEIFLDNTATIVQTLTNQTKNEIEERKLKILKEIHEMEVQGLEGLKTATVKALDNTRSKITKMKKDLEGDDYYEKIPIFKLEEDCEILNFQLGEINSKISKINNPIIPSICENTSTNSQEENKKELDETIKGPNNTLPQVVNLSQSIVITEKNVFAASQTEVSSNITITVDMQAQTSSETSNDLPWQNSIELKIQKLTQNLQKEVPCIAIFTDSKARFLVGINQKLKDGTMKNDENLQNYTRLAMKNLIYNIRFVDEKFSNKKGKISTLITLLNQLLFNNNSEESNSSQNSQPKSKKSSNISKKLKKTKVEGKTSEERLVQITTSSKSKSRLGAKDIEQFCSFVYNNAFILSSICKFEIVDDELHGEISIINYLLKTGKETNNQKIKNYYIGLNRSSCPGCAQTIEIINNRNNSNVRFRTRGNSESYEYIFQGEDLIYAPPQCLNDEEKSTFAKNLTEVNIFLYSKQNAENSKKKKEAPKEIPREEANR